MNVERGGDREPLARALGAALEGVTFYDLAHRFAADVRVKATFEDLGRQKQAQLQRLESLSGSAAKEAVTFPGIYPLDMVGKIDCYVCGYTVETQAIPDVCPRCGAARYSFEKEIARSKAWEIAGASARRGATLFRDLSTKAQGSAKALLEDLAREEDGIATKADQHVAELRT